MKFKKAIFPVVLVVLMVLITQIFHLSIYLVFGVSLIWLLHYLNFSVFEENKKKDYGYNVRVLQSLMASIVFVGLANIFLLLIIILNKKLSNSMHELSEVFNDPNDKLIFFHVLTAFSIAANAVGGGVAAFFKWRKMKTSKS